MTRRCDLKKELRGLIKEAEHLDGPRGPGGPPVRIAPGSADVEALARRLRDILVPWAGQADRHDACLITARATILMRSYGEEKWAAAFDALLHLLTGVLHQRPAAPRQN